MTKTRNAALMCSFKVASSIQSKEILAASTSACRNRSPLVRHSAEDGKLGVELLVKIHDGRNIAAAVTVVWRRPDRHDILVLEVILSIVRLRV